MMTVFRTVATCLAIVTFGATAYAQTPRAQRHDGAPLSNWSGFYIGGHVGGGFGTTRIDSPFGPSIYGDSIRMPSAFAGAQAGYNWQTSPRFLFGVEADISAMDADGTDTCLAPSGLLTSFNCRARHEMFGSVTGRFGVLGGVDGRSLVYVKGGAAWLTSNVSVALNAFETTAPAIRRDTRFGWTAGAGFEQALTPAWSLRLEYTYARFGGGSVTSPQAFLQTDPLLADYTDAPGGRTGIDHDLHLVRIGLNYRIGVDPRANWPEPRLALKAPTREAGWNVEIGGRYWYSSGRFQEDLGITTDQPLQNVLISRLTYDTTGHSGEAFGRIDSPSRVFVKGFAGGGRLGGGRMHDEDWLSRDPKESIAYSNTLSGRVPGWIGYATLDLGYDVLSADRYRFGGFIGYHYNRDDKTARGCIQLAHPVGPCAGRDAMGLSTDVISEDDTVHALRFGVAGQVALAPNLKLSAEAAYLPYARLTALDGHLQRTDVSNIWSPGFADGRGVQLEAILSYALTPNFDIGVGGRYWATWFTGDAYTNGFGKPCPCQTLPMRMERYGTFVQASYKFGPF
jgi:opacity protein-like surface antigen